MKTALELSTELDDIDYKVFLQGSYANDTNTRGDSDVDVVVMMTSTFMPDTSQLGATEKDSHARNRIPGTTTAQELRGKVERALRSYYGDSRIEPKNKCLRVAKTAGYVDADVVPALQHRRFTSYTPSGSSDWIEGISIQPLRGERIVNYPKEHIRNGQSKNGVANGNYRPTVRQVKRLRRRAVDLGRLSRTDAPGYLLECLVSNVPNRYFENDPSDRLLGVLSYLSIFDAAALREEMWSGDRIHKLFIDDPGEHNEYIAARVLGVLWDLV
ncbi:nucleotidyltransferase [Microbacteriaceae bacterium VKM Ac-2855]|nr:nucleotidyltransferase [Microbacteriaceae bacterium VKM Ac-2855]